MLGQSHARWLRLLVLAGGLAALALSSGPRSAGADGSQALRSAWERTERLGAYDFDSRIRIETQLPPAIRSVGKTAGLRQLQVKGRADRRSDGLTLRIWDDPERFGDPKAATELELSGGRARARLADGGWQELDALETSFAPAGDAAAFLRAAKHVRPLGADTRELPRADGSLDALRFERYAFSLDGERFASYLRDAATAQLRERGELPASLSLGLDRRLLEMDARGEAWIDAQGRPLRVQLRMEHPQAADGTRTIVELTTDFGYAQSDARPLGGLGGPGAWLVNRLASASRPPAPAQLSLLALVLGLAAALLRLWQRQPRRAYGIFASFMAFQLAFSSPILALTQSRQIQRFFERFPAARSVQAAEATGRGAASPFDFAPGTPRLPAAPSAGGSAAAAIASAPRPALPAAALAAQASGLPDADEDGLSDALEAVWGTRPDDPDSDDDSISDYDETIRCPHPEPRLAAERDANAASYTCPSPTRNDTDGDRLSDGEELLHIGTQVNRVDTDGDRISDYNEVKGFAFNGGREHSDARNPDSDRDGLPDGIECPSMRDAEDPGPSFAPSWTPELSCRDSQATGRPDILNIDNDGDGVPNREDLSPHAPAPGPFDAEHPMTLELAGLRQDLPVLLQVQLRPTDPKQLSYARNVLDWPSGDNQGQIQRQTDSTIGSVFGPDDPSDPAYAGDMRLVPMLQIHMPGDARDLKRIPARATIALSDAGRRVGRLSFSNQLDADGAIASTQVRVAGLVGANARLDLAKGSCDESSPVFSSAVAEGQALVLAGFARLGEVANGQHVAILRLDDVPYCSPVPDLVEGEEAVELSFEKTEPAQIRRIGALDLSQGSSGESQLRFAFEDPSARYEADIHAGRCNQLGPRIAQLSDLRDGATRSLPLDPVALADGEHLLLLRQGRSAVTCQPLGKIVSGRVGQVHQRQMIDAEALADYQVTVHEDTDGRLVALAPLRLTRDAQTGAPLAFEAAMPLRRFSEAPSRQELRVVWLVTLLGDDGRMRVVHQMPQEPWRLTGLAVEEQLGHKVALIYEDPAVDQREQLDADPATTGHLEVEDDLWVLAAGLEDNFVGNRLDPNGRRTFTLDTIVERWSTRAAEFDDTQRWGIAADALKVHRPPTYASDAALGALGSKDIPDILAASFGDGSRPLTDLLGNDQTTLAPTLLVAMESRQRGLNLDRAAEGGNLARVEGASVRLDLDPARVPEVTTASLSWKPYRYQQDRWEDYPLDLYWQRMKSVLGALPAFARTAVAGEEGRYEAAADVFIAQVAYTRLLAGIAQAVQIGNVAFSPIETETEDAELARIGEVSQLAKSEIGGRIFEVIGGITEPFYAEFKDYRKYNKLNSLVGLQKEPYSFRGALGRFLEQDAKSEAWKDHIAGFEDATHGGWRQHLVDSGVADRIRSASIMASAVGIFLDPTIGPEGATVENVAGLTLQSVVSTDTSFEFLRHYLAYKAFQLENPGTGLTDFMRETDTGKAARIAGVASTVMSTGISFGIFFAAVERKGIEPGSPVYNAELVGVVAELVIEALMTALALNGAGMFVVAVLELFDALAGLACNATPMSEEEREDAWYCKGLKGLLAEAVAYLIYAETDIVAVDNPSRLAVTRLNPFFAEPERGFVPAQLLTIELTLRNRVKRQAPEGIGGQRPAQFSLDQARQAAFDYAITSAEIGAPTPKLGSTAWTVVDPSLSMTQSLKASLPGPARAGINVPVDAYLAEGYTIQAQRCAGLGLAACWLASRSDSHYMSLGLAYDLFPPRLADFYALAPKGSEGGFALAWGAGGGLSFPILADADGDGLHHAIDPDDSRADRDADGVPDPVEMARGSNPLLANSDADALSDAEELRFGSDLLRADSDGDGLPDDAERDGWELVYNRSGDRTRVFPDPRQPDADQDGILDGREQVLGFSPWAANDSTVLSYVTQLREPTAPMLLMRMNEASGATSTTDSSQANSPNVGHCSAPACPVTGHRAYQGNTARFDGLDDHFRIDPIPELGALTNDFFVGAWIMPARVDGRQRLVGHSRQRRDDGIGFGLEDDGLVLSFYGLQDFRAPGLGIPVDAWSYVFATARRVVDPSNGQVSTEVSLGWTNLQRDAGDGATVSAALDGALADLDEPLTIGAVYAPGPDPEAPPSVEEAFAGRIDELVVVGAALASEEEILPNLLGLYNLDDGIAAPGQALVHETDLTNRLLGKNISGLLEVDLPEVLASAAPAYTSFDLAPASAEASAPAEKRILHPMTVNPDAASGDYTIRQDMAATIDRKTVPVGNLSQQSYRDAILYDLDRMLILDRPWDPKWRPYRPGAGASGRSIQYVGGDITIAAWIDWDDYRWLGNVNLRQGIMGYDAGRDIQGSRKYQPKTSLGMVGEAYPSLMVEDGHIIFGFGCDDGDNGWCEVRSVGRYVQKDEPVHVAISYSRSANVARLYIDQVPVEDLVTAGMVPKPASKFVIGSANEHNYALLPVRSLCDHAALVPYPLSFGVDGEPNRTTRIALVGARGTTETLQPVRFRESFSAHFSGSRDEGSLVYHKLSDVDEFGDDPFEFTSTDGCAFAEIGMHPASTFGGSIWDLEVYGLALDDDQIEDVVASRSTIARFKLDEVPGQTRFADTVGGSHGNCFDAGCPVAGLRGRENLALGFDGIDDWVELINTGDLLWSYMESAEATGFSLGAWLQAGDLEQTGTLLSLRYPGSSRPSLDLRAVPDAFGLGEMRFWFGEDDLAYAFPGDSFSRDAWHHVLVTVDKQTYRGTLYVDGRARQSFDMGPLPQRSILSLGIADGGRFPLAGRLDEVIIGKGLMDAAAVDALYRGVPTLSLPLDEGEPDLPGWGAELVEGQINEGRQFVDASDRVQLGDASLYNLYGGDFSLVAWVMAEEMAGLPGATQTLPIVAPENGSTGLFLGLFDGKPLAFISADGKTSQAQAAQPIPPNQWTQLVFRRRADPDQDGKVMLEIFVNGSRVKAVGGLEPIAEGPDRGLVSLGGNANRSWRGRLDEVNLYRKALTDEDIATLFNYQNTWIDESSSAPLTIDGEPPAVKLPQSGSYLPLGQTVLGLEAADAQSATQLVVAIAESDDHEDVYAWGYPCPGTKEGAQICLELDPPGEGRYDLTLFPVDRVGNFQEQDGREAGGERWRVLVDGSPPSLQLDPMPADAFRPRPEADDATGWTLQLAGSVRDPAIADLPGSGVARVEALVRDANGLPLGEPPLQQATLEGEAWRLDYHLRSDQPTGSYSGELQAYDAVGNRVALTLPEFQVDATDPAAVVTRFGGAGGGLTANGPTRLDQTAPAYLGADAVISGRVDEKPETIEAQDRVAGVAGVQIAAEPILPEASTWVDAPSPPEVLLHLPFDGLGDEGVAGGGSYADIVGDRVVACEDPGCPEPSLASRNGQALGFDGVDDQLQLVETDPALAGLTTDFTLAAWIKPESLDGVGRIVSTRRGAGGFSFGHAGRRLLLTTWFVFDYQSSRDLLEPGVWQHVAVHLNPDHDAEFYVNGILVETVAGDQPARQAGDSPILIGAADRSGDPAISQAFAGAIDEVIVAEGRIAPVHWDAVFGLGPTLHLSFDERIVVQGSQLADDGGMGARASYAVWDPADETNHGQLGIVGPSALNLTPASDGFRVQAPAGVLPAPGRSYSIAFWAEDLGLGRLDYGDNHIAYDGSLQIGMGGQVFSAALGETAGWHHYALSWDEAGSMLAIFIDGNPLGSVTIASGAGLSQPATELRFTHQSASQRYALDDLRVYQRALPASEMMALAAERWFDATVEGLEGGPADSASWTAGLPPGLEGFYALKLRGADREGNVDQEPKAQWSGSLDTLAPRLLGGSYAATGDGITLTLQYADFNLDLDSLVLPGDCETRLNIDAQRYRTPWYLALTALLPSAGEADQARAKIHRVTLDCRASYVVAGEPITLCDRAGNCSTVAYPGASIGEPPPTPTPGPSPSSASPTPTGPRSTPGTPIPTVSFPTATGRTPTATSSRPSATPEPTKGSGAPGRTNYLPTLLQGYRVHDS